MGKQPYRLPVPWVERAEVRGSGFEGQSSEFKKQSAGSRVGNMRTIAILCGCGLMLAGASCVPSPGGGSVNSPADNANANVDAGMSAIRGLEFFSRSGCSACHCNDGQGDCNLGAPSIQGMARERVDARLRQAQSIAPHPVKLPGTSDEEIDDLTTFLQTLDGGLEIEGESQITRGYQLYLSAGCIACHLSSAQGVNQGGIGQAIAGTDPDNIYLALAGGVPCHPLQREIPDGPVCSVTGQYMTNETVQMLTDTPPPGTDAERVLLGWFLAFIAPQPVGVVEPCNDVPGEICTVAGTGVPGYTGDDVTATDTLLYTPQNLAITDWNADGTLDLALSDWNNHRIRLVYIDAEIDGVANRIVSLAGTGKVTGADALNHPLDLAFDADGALVISGWHNQNVYRYPRGLVNGADRDQLAGLCDLLCSEDTGAPTPVDETFLALPSSIALHPDGRIFLAEQGCSRIRVLNVAGERVPAQPTGCITSINFYPEGTIETLAGELAINDYRGDGGPARDALFRVSNMPTVPNFGIALSREANPRLLYVSDSLNNCIRRIDLQADPPMIDLFAGQPGSAGFADGAAIGEALFNFPINVDLDDAGNVYVSDSRNHAIRRIDTAGNITTIAGTGQAGFNGDNQPATQALLDNPGAVAVHPDGRIFMADTNNNRVRVIAPVRR